MFRNIISGSFLPTFQRILRRLLFTTQQKFWKKINDSYTEELLLKKTNSNKKQNDSKMYIIGVFRDDSNQIKRS